MNGNNENYEALVPSKLTGKTKQLSAYLAGGGLASLATAVFLLRDGHLEGTNIHIFEELSWENENVESSANPFKSYVLRGGMPVDKHAACLRNLLESVPSLEAENRSVWEELTQEGYWSDMHATVDRGIAGHVDKWFQLSDDSLRELIKLFFTSEEELNDKRISDVFSEEFFDSNFWNYWRYMFAFDEWHSAMEMRRYLIRFLSRLDKLPELSVFKFTKFNPYRYIFFPIISFLKSRGVHFYDHTKVVNVLIDTVSEEKVARKIAVEAEGTLEEIDLDENSLVFITNGSITDSSTYGDQQYPPRLDSLPGGSWSLWKNLTVQDRTLGKPEKFCSNILETSLVSATLTTRDGIIPSLLEEAAGRSAIGNIDISREIITVEDSNWLMSFTLINRPSCSEESEIPRVSIWLCGLLPYRLGNYVKKQMKDCTGEEIAEEWLYHLGVPRSDIHRIAATSAYTIPCFMPYALSYFTPRALGDRPAIVPQGAVNFAFIGNFAETPGEVAFTPEYATRTALEAVHRLLKLPGEVPEPSPSSFDVRVWLRSLSQLADGKKLYNMDLPFISRFLSKKAMEKSKGTVIYEMLKEYNLI